MVQTRHQKKLLRRKKKKGDKTSSSSAGTDEEPHDEVDGAGGSSTTRGKRRRSNRGSNSGLEALANRIVRGERVVFVTGAGLSVASGVRPFRQEPGDATRRGGGGGGGPSPLAAAGLWNSVIWSTATRECFRKDPLRWYNRFFLPHFVTTSQPPPQPSWGHRALNEMLDEFSNVCQVTQNIDGLQPPSSRLVEVHGRVGLYKCLNDEDDDSDWDESDLDESDNDNDDDKKNSAPSSSTSSITSSTATTAAVDVGDEGETTGRLAVRRRRRRVRLGHRAKGQRYREHVGQCQYRYREALPAHLVEGSAHVKDRLAAARPDHPPSNDAHRGDLESVPTCPGCGKTVMPLALLFDEGYHSHSFYRFEEVEAWIESADVLVFCGTSFSVRVTSVALKHAQESQLPVYNFNTVDLLSASKQLDVTNIVGDVEETLPRLMRACREQQQRQQKRDANRPSPEQAQGHDE